MPCPQFAALATTALKGIVRARMVTFDRYEWLEQKRMIGNKLCGLLGRQTSGANLPSHALVDDFVAA